MPVRVVTDSTADLPREVAEELRIEVVPLSVNFGTQVFKDGVDLSADELYRRMSEGGTVPTTSQPSVADFIEVYQRVGRDADGIVSVHVSSKVSGTVNSARQAVEQAGVACPIRVVDTLQASMGVGLVAMEGARAALRGEDIDHVAAAAEDAMGRAECITLLGTLEYLRKGGRIGRAQALLGSVLRIHPMIVVTEGEVWPYDRPRSWSKGLQKLREAAAKHAPLQALCVCYSTGREEAVQLAADLASLLTAGATPSVARFGPTLGVYVGPRALGVAMLRAKKG